MSLDPKSRASYPKDAVIKMEIGNGVHRVELDCITDENGNLSYDNLARWAIRYSSSFKDKGEAYASNWDSNWTTMMKDWDVDASYTDEDGDQVCFATEEEFIEALRESAKIAGGTSSVVLRCRVAVKPMDEPNAPKDVALEVVTPQVKDLQIKTEVDEANKEMVAPQVAPPVTTASPAEPPTTTADPSAAAKAGSGGLDQVTDYVSKLIHGRHQEEGSRDIVGQLEGIVGDRLQEIHERLEDRRTMRDERRLAHEEERYARHMHGGH